MFCPKCGSKKVVDVFCADCLKEEKPLITSFKEFKASVCTKSGAIKFHGKWHPTENHTSRLAELFTQQVVTANNADITEVRIALPDIPLKDGLKVTGEADVTVTGRASKSAKFYDEHYVVPFEVQNTISPRHAKEGTQYFEGVLQLRNEDKDRKKFMLDTLHRFGASVSKEVKQKQGTDYFVTRKNALEKTARTLVDRYGGLVKSSAHLFGRDKQRSKDVYRETWFVELSPYNKGDCVKKGKDVLFVTDVGKKIRLFNPMRGKNEMHEYKATWRQLPVLETSVAAVMPELTVLHPETFQAVPVANAKTKSHTPGETIKVVVDGKRVFLFER